MEKLFTFLFVIVLGAAATAQPQYDVRFNIDSTDCVNEEIFIDIDVKASSAAAEFNIADQNYRFSFNRAAIVPASADIYKQELTGLLFNDDNTFGLYDDHTLTGTLDTIVSYNVVHNGGAGKFVSNNWLTVGTLKFAINGIDDDCLELQWHEQSTFPPTFISRVGPDAPVPIAEGAYTSIIDICISDICSNASLPVELTDFDAVDNARDCEIELSWTTETETNNDFFRIEKSLDGFNYQPIGTVNAVGNSVTPTTYSFVDRTPSITNYYRLRQVDVDGAATVSSQLIVNSGCFEEGIDNTILEVFPNPVTKEANFKFYNTTLGDRQVTLDVLDILGQTVYTQNVQVIEGPNLISFHTDQLIPGTYLIQLKGDGWFSNAQKIVKVKN